MTTATFTFQYFLCKLGMKPHLHLVEISIFSQHDFFVRLTKIMKTLIFKVLYFLQMCPIFMGSVHNFGRWHYLVKKCLFPLNAYMVSCLTRSKNLWRSLILKSCMHVDCTRFHSGLKYFLKIHYHIYWWNYLRILP